MATQESADTFRILVASDIHLGFMENDPKRGNDSFVTFEEILSIAREKNVDLILHGGDLFHENKPSRQTLHACLALLREYCMGDKAVQFEYLSDQSADFQHCKFQSVNYEDPNLNVSIPMFSIHGNHDDPTGQGNLCSLDLLHTAGLVNYFGKASSLDKIQISPLLLQKGDTRLALYGLGSIRDERLHRVFVSQNVTMLRPREHQDAWFNLFVLHQNRVKHSATSYIPEQFLENFLDLVIWGHEHECRLNVNDVYVEQPSNLNFFICQPGSSIATSLSESETVPKHVGLLEINKKQFRMKPIRLNTVRQFYLQDLVLSQHINPDTKADEALKRIEAICKEKVEGLIDKAWGEHSGSRKQPPEPLIRLRVDYTGFTPFSAQRFGKQFVDNVANPKTIIHFVRRRQQNQNAKDKNSFGLLDSVQPMVLDSTRVEDMVHNHFIKADGDARLEVLSEKGMGMAVKEYVDKGEKAAISELVKYQVGKTQISLKSRNTTENDIDGEIQRIKEKRQRTVEEDKDIKEALQQAHSLNESETNVDDLSDEDDTTSAPPTSRGRGRGRGRGAGSRGGRGGRGRGRKNVVMEEDSPDETETASSSKPTKGGVGSRRGRKSAVVNTQQSSITDMFPSTSRKSKTHIEESDDEDMIILDDSDDDVKPTSIKSSVKSNQGASQRQSQRASKRKTRGANFFESDDDDNDEPPRSKRRT